MFSTMLYRVVPLLLAAFAASAQKYDGPLPPKPDVPYLKQAAELVTTEVGQAKEEKKKDDVTYIVEGAASSAKTPLASPIFIFKADKISPDKAHFVGVRRPDGGPFFSKEGLLFLFLVDI